MCTISDTKNKGSTSKDDKGKSQKKMVVQIVKVKEEKVDGFKGKGRAKVEKNTKTKIKGKGKGKKDGDDDRMDVDVESEDDGSDKDAEGEVVDEEDDTNIKQKPSKSTTFRPKPIAKAPTIGTRASKRLKLEAPNPLIVNSTSGTSSSDVQDLAALLIVKASSSCM
jgi:hypothetical protein